MSEARIAWISGPVLRARTRGVFHIHEALRVGRLGILGEVIQLEGDELIAQVYEDTTGLRPGDLVRGTGGPLAITLGPGLLGQIVDGLLRPLDSQGQLFVEPGEHQGRAERPFGFAPAVTPGDTIAGGAVLGELAGRGPQQRCLAPPGVGGRVVSVAAPGEYLESDTVCTVEDERGERHALTMLHEWPVRRPRPVAARLALARPLITGQRIFDSFFPVALGGRAALPGGFGTGKTVLQQALAKWCDADVIVYVGCGERGNEMAEVLDEFPRMEDPHTGGAMMDRTVIIANTSNMPVAAREASIYTAVTVAEFFRDQGLDVALMADSTSRWAEALREVSGRLGELPGEAGYPAYLSARLAEFYERAARVRALSGGEGSVTIIGAVSPPAGDFSEPVTTHTKRYVRCFWALDRERAQARFYPAVHPLTSYSEDAPEIARFWELEGNPEWLAHRRQLLELLGQQARLERMARIVGKDALPPAQRLTLLCGELVDDGFLRQSAFSPVDRFCSPARQSAMLRLIVRFIELASESVRCGVDPERIVALPGFRRLQRVGEEIGEGELERFGELLRELEADFASLQPSTEQASAR